MKILCKIEGCHKPVKFIGLCKQCYYKAYDKKPHRVAYRKGEFRLKQAKEYAKNIPKDIIKARSKKHAKTDKYKIQQARSRQKIESRFKVGIRTAGYRGIEWGILLEQYIKLTDTVCHYCDGLLTRFGHNLDRKENDKGYTIDNCVPCCKACNRIKGENLTYEEMLEVSKLLKTLRKNKCIAA